MGRKTLKQFHSDLSWSTRIYMLLTVSIIAGSFLFNAWTTNWALTIILGLAVILFVESFAISFHRHPKTWKVIRWIVVLIVLTLLLIGFQKGSEY